MKVGELRARMSSAMDVAMRTREAGAIGLAADRAKAVGVALAGMADDADVTPDQLSVSTRDAASVLGFHPEHVRRLVRAGSLPAERIGGDYRIRIDDLWPLLQARHRPPGQRRRPAGADADGAPGGRDAGRGGPGHAGGVHAA
jgi:excisionase family DNA binding protein